MNAINKGTQYDKLKPTILQSLGRHIYAVLGFIYSPLKEADTDAISQRAVG